ncbi:hypothetical protein BZA70DRAFT_235047 [Myxozyma melibiosi]|uniref:ethanolamine-phosphate cytidylyltransferase n=1 Tax=Myxozyma melibiosi TaxID=54550 RepID=A0ABR1FD93_9ASCO
MVSEKPGISKDRIWIDGCFDFAHHGHAGAMLQARQLGNSLYVGVHSDEEILENKGPVVMTLPERVLAVEACKWATKAVPGAPYVTDPAVMDEWGCFYVVHGDDITTDANGEDCYRVVKEAGRFLIVKRTPNISTTDLVGRMLLCTKNHHIQTVKDASKEAGLITRQNLDKFNTYATSEDGRSARDGVYIYAGDSLPATLIKPDEGFMKKQRKMIYVDGGFDLFFAGHIEFLRLVSEASKSIANDLGEEVGIVVGIHDDATVNKFKGLNYPIMNLFERALCVLQCKYVSHIVLQAPYSPSKQFIESLPWDIIRVMHGPTDFTASAMTDPYSEAKALGLYLEIANHQYSSISTETIVERVTRNRGVYEERQRRKGWKAEVESKLLQAESQ